MQAFHPKVSRKRVIIIGSILKLQDDDKLKVQKEQDHQLLNYCSKFKIQIFMDEFSYLCFVSK